MTGSSPTRELAAAPASLPLMLKAVLPAVPGVALLPGVRRSARDLPDLTLGLKGVTIDPAHVRAYAEVCGFPVKDTVPLPYPHLLAFPLHMALMTDRSFPLPAIGTVHLENSITQHRTIAPGEALDVSVRATNLRGHAKGRVYDLLSVISADDQVVWEETSTFLVRGKGDPDAPAGLDLPQVPATTGIEWRLASDLGRRYGAVSGDRNPIHLYPLTAKAFGFPRHIAHGMWSKARCLAALENRLPDAVRVDVAFKTPILLPGKVAFGSRGSDRVGDFDFALSNPKSGAPHLVGRTRAA